MASNKTQALISLLLLSLSAIISSSHAAVTGGVAVYWGQNGFEGDLRDACASGNYEIVLLAFLHQFGEGRTPAWNFAGHCDNGAVKHCTELEPEIKYCQSLGIKVLLSLGGDSWNYGLSSPEDAKEVADYLYKNFLSGQYGPLGSVELDGIDFDIEHGELYYDDLAKELDALRQPPARKFYLSAAPQCPSPPKWNQIYYLQKAIDTGLFDYVLVQFYNNPDCSYAKGRQALLDSWDAWVSLLPSNNTLFLGLPAAPSAAGSGYISPDDLIKDVLPHIKESPNYGGVMLWDRYRDLPPADFSGKILPYIQKSTVAVIEPAWRRVLSK